MPRVSNGGVSNRLGVQRILFDSLDQRFLTFCGTQIPEKKSLKPRTQSL